MCIFQVYKEVVLAKCSQNAFFRHNGITHTSYTLCKQRPTQPTHRSAPCNPPPPPNTPTLIRQHSHRKTRAQKSPARAYLAVRFDSNPLTTATVLTVAGRSLQRLSSAPLQQIVSPRGSSVSLSCRFRHTAIFVVGFRIHVEWFK